MAFLAGMGGRQVILLDELVALEPPPDWLTGWPLAMSGDGQVVACRVVHARSKKESVFVNGRLGKEYDQAGAPVLSADGRVVCYRAVREGRSFVVAGDREGPGFDQMIDPVVTPDGRVVAYAGKRGDRWIVVAGDREIVLDHEPFQVFLSPDGRRVGWTRFEAQTGGGSKMRVLVEGEAGEAFNLVGRPVFSPDGRVVAHWAEAGEKTWMVIGGWKAEVVGRVSDPVFSRDGRQVGYGTRLGREIWWKALDVR